MTNIQDDLGSRVTPEPYVLELASSEYAHAVQFHDSEGVAYQLVFAKDAPEGFPVVFAFDVLGDGSWLPLPIAEPERFGPFARSDEEALAFGQNYLQQYKTLLAEDGRLVA